MTLCELAGPEGKSKTTVVVKPPIERLQHFWQRGQFYERKVLQYIYDHHRSGVFVDVGSNIGNHTLWFAMYCADIVVSVEPVKALMDWQLENLKLNSLDNVHALNVALSDRAGQGEMVKAPENPHARWPWNLGMWRLEPGDGLTRVVTLDDLLSEHSITGVSLVKMDIEGFELRALMGAKQLLERKHPALFLEAQTEIRACGLSAFLESFGYTGRLVHKNMYEFTWQR